MEEKIVLSDWKMIVYAVICVGVLLFGLFRLDEVFARRGSSGKPPKRPMGHDVHGRTMFSDPDGKVWKRRRD